jgi:hypothetical protein
MAMELETPLRSLLSNLGLDLYDLEMVKGTLNVVVNKPGGVDLESLTRPIVKYLSGWTSTIPSPAASPSTSRARGSNANSERRRTSKQRSAKS